VLLVPRCIVVVDAATVEGTGDAYCLTRIPWHRLGLSEYNLSLRACKEGMRHKLMKISQDSFVGRKREYHPN
jgi:hypothetical protein